MIVVVNNISGAIVSLVILIVATHESIGDVLFILLEILDALFVHAMCQSTDLFRDLGELLLDHRWGIGGWSLENGQESPEDAADLKLELEVAHEFEPIGEHSECLLLLLDDCQRG